MKGTGRLSPRQLARLQALLEVRDDLARQRNRPPFKVFNQLLIDWAQAPPEQRADRGGPGRGGPSQEPVAAPILAGLQRAEALPEGECPRPECRRGAAPAEARRLPA